MTRSGSDWPADEEPGSRPALSRAGGEAADPPPPLEGDRYVRGPLVGAGGMGRVVLAYDRLLDREVALKEVPPDADPVLRARLAREAAILARLDHPGVVPVHDRGRWPDGTVYFAMRVVRGRTLAQLFADAAPDRDRLLRATLAAAETVGFAHALGVIHRDLKPANILVGEFGETQVVDWGLARVLDQPDDAPPEGARPGEDAALTRVGAVLGTPQYMAPEQAAGRPADARSDVWSLGAVLFELVAGRAPHAGGSADEVLDAARTAPPPAATGRAVGVPLELGAIVDRALAPTPAARYADAKALADDLARYLDGRRVEAHSYSTVDLLRRVLRAWRAPLAVGAVALATLAVAGLVGWRATDAERVRAQSAEAATRAALERADRDLARALVAEAIDRAADEAAPEAEVLAAHALRLAESADARGVLMRFGGAPRPALIDERPLAGECAAPLPAPDGALTCPDTLSRPLRHVGPGLRVWWDAGFLTVQRGDAAPWTRRACAPGAIDAVAIDEARARWAALCSQGELRVAGLAEDATPAVAPLSLTADRQPAAAAAFTPDGARLVVGTLTGHVVLLDAATGAVLRRAAGDAGPARTIDVSADGGVAAVLSDRGGARLWDVATGAWLGRLRRGGPPRSASRPTPPAICGPWGRRCAGGACPGRRPPAWTSRPA
ncbi:MAG: protein kinase [Myxococcales bacterium]|nr:protein kinase [Myxococcales bacterium]